MPNRKFPKFIYFLICFLLIFEQSGFAQIAGELDISGHLALIRNSLIQDKFRPLHLRSLQYLSQNNSFKLLLDKGDAFKKGDGSIFPESTSRKIEPSPFFSDQTKTLLNYFFIGLSLPNDSFWVNLRPDSPDNIIDEYLSKTDVGRIMLETDLQLKKDTASFTSPQTPEGREYWDKLYKKASDLYGYDNVTIPTLTRPWIVPDEIIIRETRDAPSAYIYKATLKVMLEEDYLKKAENRGQMTDYTFKDPQLKALNEYSTQLIRELIIPKLTKEVSTSKRYAPLRQVYYSLILAQWFKARYRGQGTGYRGQKTEDRGQKNTVIASEPQASEAISSRIDSCNLTNLISKQPWSKTNYFQAYQKSFKDGEYNIKEPAYTPTGQVIRSYFSGGIIFNIPMPVASSGIAAKMVKGPTEVTTILGDEHVSSPLTDNNIPALAVVNKSETDVIVKETPSSALSAERSPLGASDKIETVVSFSMNSADELAKKDKLSLSSPVNQNNDKKINLFNWKKWLIGFISFGLIFFPVINQKVGEDEDKLNNNLVTIENPLIDLVPKNDNHKIDILALRKRAHNGDAEALNVLVNLASHGNFEAVGALTYLDNVDNNISAKEGLRDLDPQVFVKRAQAGDGEAVLALGNLAYRGNKSAEEGRQALDYKIFIEKTLGGDKNAFSALRNLININSEIREALKNLNPTALITKALAGDENAIYVLDFLASVGNAAVLETLINLVTEGNKKVRDGISSISNARVVRMRRAHLDLRIPESELKKQLTENSLNDHPYLLYALYTSPENFSDLAKMIFQRLNAQAANKGKDLHSFLQGLDPGRLFYKDFILQTANFNMLSNLLASPEALYEIMDYLFKASSIETIKSYSLRFALFTENILNDSKFKYQRQFQDYLLALYYQSKGLYRRMLASLLVVYKNKFSLLKESEISKIAQEEKISYADIPINYNKLLKDSWLNVDMVFADGDAVKDHFQATLDLFQGRNPSFPHITGYRVISSTKQETLLEKGKIRIALIKADEQKYDINQRFNSTGMFISRSHAGNEKNVFSQQQNPLSALEKIFLISACRSATDAGEINNSYPGAQIISINSIAVGLRTSIVTYYMLEGLAERAPTLLDVKESIRKHLRKGVEDYVFPNDPAYRVFSIVASSSPIIEREGSPVSPLTEGENNPASSAMDQNINRRQFLKGGVIAVASLLPLNKAGADMLEIFGISLVDIDSASDPRIKIVEDALKKLQPWEVELLRRYNINIRDVKNFQSRGRVQKREVLLNHEEHGDSFTTEGGFTIDAIIHEIGHVIYMIIMPEMLKDRWLPNFMTWAQRERLVSEVSREYERNKSYGLPGNIIKTSVDLPNDRLISYEKVYLGRKGDERYSWNPKYKTEGEFIYSETARNLDFRRRVEEFMGKIEKVTGNKIPYDRVKQAYMTYGEGSFMKQWYDINEKAEIEYSFDAYFFGKKPPSKGFASSYSQRGIHEEMAEIYMLMRLYPEKLKELVESDEFVRDKVKLMEGLLNELEKEYKKNPTGSSPILTDIQKQANSIANNSINDSKGGIDFRALPVVSSPVNPAMLKLSPAQIKRLSSLNLDSEWAEIQNMLRAGIIPSNERVREYVASSCLKQSLGNQMGKVLGCIANILRMEEDRVTQTEPELEDMLVLIESGKPESELQLGLVQIQIPAREPQVITP